jgi:hypothetical protein
VLRLANPEAVDHPNVSSILEKAFGDGRWARPEDVREWIRWHCDDPRMAVLLARRDVSVVGILIATDLEDSPGAAPWVQHLHCPDDEEARMALTEEVFGWARDRGHSTVWAINASGLPDDAYVSLVHGQIVGARVLGSAIAFNF